jgi:NAD(P)-dependent dehydrogenase (short-subunit alcohol dehydrogenase family)
MSDLVGFLFTQFPMKYFVTGATGFVGKEVTRQLRAHGHDVIAIARNPAKAQDLIAMGVDVRKGDITDTESMRVPMTVVWWLMLFGVLENLFVMTLQAFAPFGFNDGATLWKWVPRL